MEAHTTGASVTQQAHHDQHQHQQHQVPACRVTMMFQQQLQQDCQQEFKEQQANLSANSSLRFQDENSGSPLISGMLEVPGEGKLESNGQQQQQQQGPTAKRQPLTLCNASPLTINPRRHLSQSIASIDHQQQQSLITTKDKTNLNQHPRLQEVGKSCEFETKISERASQLSKRPPPTGRAPLRLGTLERKNSDLVSKFSASSSSVSSLASLKASTRNSYLRRGALLARKRAAFNLASIHQSSSSQDHPLANSITQASRDLTSSSSSTSSSSAVTSTPIQLPINSRTNAKTQQPTHLNQHQQPQPQLQLQQLIPSRGPKQLGLRECQRQLNAQASNRLMIPRLKFHNLNNNSNSNSIPSRRALELGATATSELNCAHIGAKVSCRVPLANPTSQLGNQIEQDQHQAKSNSCHNRNNNNNFHHSTTIGNPRTRLVAPRRAANQSFASTASHSMNVTSSSNYRRVQKVHSPCCSSSSTGSSRSSKSSLSSSSSSLIETTTTTPIATATATTTESSNNRNEQQPTSPAALLDRNRKLMLAGSKRAIKTTATSTTTTPTASSSMGTQKQLSIGSMSSGSSGNKLSAKTTAQVRGASIQVQVHSSRRPATKRVALAAAESNQRLNYNGGISVVNPLDCGSCKLSPIKSPRPVVVPLRRRTNNNNNNLQTDATAGNNNNCSGSSKTDSNNKKVNDSISSNNNNKSNSSKSKSKASSSSSSSSESSSPSASPTASGRFRDQHPDEPVVADIGENLHKLAPIMGAANNNAANQPAGKQLVSAGARVLATATEFPLQLHRTPAPQLERDAPTNQSQPEPVPIDACSGSAALKMVGKKCQSVALNRIVVENNNNCCQIYQNQSNLLISDITTCCHPTDDTHPLLLANNNNNNQEQFRLLNDDDQEKTSLDSIINQKQLIDLEKIQTDKKNNKSHLNVAMKSQPEGETFMLAAEINENGAGKRQSTFLIDTNETNNNNQMRSPSQPLGLNQADNIGLIPQQQVTTNCGANNPLKIATTTTITSVNANSPSITSLPIINNNNNNNNNIICTINNNLILDKNLNLDQSQSQHHQAHILKPQQTNIVDIPISLDSINDHYEVETRPFARGKFAQVKRCINKSTMQCFAAKCIKKRRRSIDMRNDILLEIEALKLSYVNEFIVKIYQVYETPSEMILILEMANGGELQRVVDEEERLEEDHCRQIISQILNGLTCLHQNDIAHLDIKPQNILLTNSYPNCQVKLCDFGMSRRISKDCELREICGTPDYVAPEILRYDPISLTTDMWSLGILTYVLLSGYSPFGGETKQQTFCNITQAPLDFPSEYFESVSKSAIDFMCKMIVRNPKSRYSSKQATEHTWLN